MVKYNNFEANKRLINLKIYNLELNMSSNLHSLLLSSSLIKNNLFQNCISFFKKIINLTFSFNNKNNYKLINDLLYIILKLNNTWK